MSHKTVKQMLLRKGCIQKTWGAQLVDGLKEGDFDIVIRRSKAPFSYSPPPLYSLNKVSAYCKYGNADTEMC